MKTYLTMIVLLFVLPPCFAASAKAIPIPSSPSESTLPALLTYGLDHSLDLKSAEAETRYQTLTAKLAGQVRTIPQIAANGAVQTILHDDNKPDAGGNLVSNNGHGSSLGVVLTYDLQKLFGPESLLANRALELSKIQQKITRRDVIRNIKRSYFTINEIQTELSEIEKVIGYFDRVKAVLQKQTRIGMNIRLDHQQFQIQQSILRAELETRKTDLESAFSSLSLALNADLATTKSLVGKSTLPTHMQYASQAQLDPVQLASFNDQEMLTLLNKDYDIAKLEYEKFHSFGLPNIYAKLTRDMPVYVSSDGPTTTAEVGVSIPIDSFFTRSTQRSQLGAKAAKIEILWQKAVREYRNQIQLDAANLNRLKAQDALLEQTLTATRGLLNNSFLYYSQKRLDVLGTLDVFSKYMQASKNSLNNKLQMGLLDAELEYLVGGAS